MLIRVLGIIQMLLGVAYLKYRFTDTIGVFNNTALFLIYQYTFYVLEVMSFVSCTMRYWESWMVTKRNCIDLDRIPNHMISPLRNTQDKENNPGASQSVYPTVDIFIPCYNEDVDLVNDTITAALNVRYPSHLLNIYLCDDGQDPSKRSMISHLRNKHTNLHYIVRPVHNHAKAGNLNFALNRTTGNLCVILDADFVARPNLLQRLVPYYYVWNPVSQMYEFDNTLAAVQAPQQFRNLSPFDPDPTDQRATFFMEVILPAKDWFNASPLIGTTNLLNRDALAKASYFPYHSVTEDTALSIVFHGMGYSTYYVNEPLASGLATTSLWSNFDQRERWLQGDWQIMFSDKGPLTMPGLSIFQRLLYLNMSWNRLISIVHLLYDFASVLLLVFGFAMVDVPNTWKFVRYLGPYTIIGFMIRLARTLGSKGYAKSENAAVAFEVMFRFVTLKGMFQALTKGHRIKFNVTDKRSTAEKEKARIKDMLQRDWVKNLRRSWFNVMMAVLLSFSIAYCLRHPPSFRTDEFGNVDGAVLPLTLAVGFASANLLPHLLAVYLCFIPLVSGWEMEDLVHGRCDQYAVDPVTGKRFVPPSFISVLNVLQLALIFGSMVAISVYTLRGNDDAMTMLIPIRR